MKEMLQRQNVSTTVSGSDSPHSVEVVVEVPRGGFLKRGSTGHLDFISPFPCPFNYGSVPDRLGGEGDLLDAIVLGPRLRAGTRLKIEARAAIGLAERNMYDDKLVCSAQELSPADRRLVWYFMHFYALCKGIRNRLRGDRGRTYCTGWEPLDEALARARPLPDHWPGPAVRF